MNISKMAFILLLTIILFSPSAIQAEEDPTTDPGYYPKEYIDMKNPVPFDLTTMREGRKAYSAHCEECHGVYGDGKGHTAVIKKFKPMPRNFTDDNMMSQKNDGMLYYSITKGIHGTQMFAREEIMPTYLRWAVIHYIRTFAKTEDRHTELDK